VRHIIHDEKKTALDMSKGDFQNIQLID